MNELKSKFSELTLEKKQKVYDLMSPRMGWTPTIGGAIDPATGIAAAISNPETKKQWYERTKDEERLAEFRRTRSAIKAEEARAAEFTAEI